MGQSSIYTPKRILRTTRSLAGTSAVLAILAILAILVLLPAVEARHGLCVDGSFGPAALIMPAPDLEPVDVSYHDEPDFQQRLVSYRGDLHVTWLTEEEDPEVTEYLFMRTLGPEGWGPRLVVNNPVPEDGEFKGVDIRVAGYDLVEHEGLLWFVWSTPSVEQADGNDGDIVLRTFDGTDWGPIVEVTRPGDEAIDNTPSLTSDGDRLLLAWTTGTQAGRGIVMSWMDDEGWTDPVEVTDPAAPGDVFNPMVTAIPGGAVIAWHHRDPTLEDPTRVTVVARLLEGDELGAPFPVPEGTGYEDIWFDMMWVEDRLMMTWQRAGNPLGFQRSQVMYREWRPEGMGPEVDITGAADGGFNGRPRIGLTDEGPRVYWHTDDDGVTLGTSEDLVWRGLGADGTWGPVTAYQEDPDQDMVRVQLVEHRGQLWAAWMANVTFYEGPDLEPHPAWDIFVAPAHLGSGPATGGTVEVRWENCEDLGDRTVLVLEGLDGPMAYGPLEVVLVDPDGNEETVLAGTTDGEGRVEFDHGYHQRGGYTLTVVLDGDAVATVPVEVGSVPDHVVLDHNFAITTFIWVVAFGLVGYLVLRRKRRA